MAMLKLGLGVGAVGAVAGAWVYGALVPGSQLFGRTLIAGNDPREIALTYDDGPNDRCTEPLLETLDRYGVKATFFMIGRFVRERPDLARKVHAAGHVVGNHTMTHPWLAWQPSRRVHEELRGCHDALQDALGAPVHNFRPPHGARRPMVIRAARELGMTTVQWNAMGYDWRAIDAAKIVANVARGMKRAKARGKGTNILLHDGWDVAMGGDRSATLQATEMLLQQIKQNGDRVVTVDHWRQG